MTVLALKNNELAIYGSAEIAAMNNAIIADEGNQFFATIDDTGSIAWQQAGEMPENGSPANHPDFDFWKIPDGSGGWVDAPVPEPEQILVSPRRFTNQLIGLVVYGGFGTMLDGLRAKFAAGTATAEDMQKQTILNAADRMLLQPDPIDLLSPDVSMILDLAVANPHIAFTAEDKARVLRNEVIVVPA